jgi:hypothetical protein
MDRDWPAVPDGRRHGHFPEMWAVLKVGGCPWKIGGRESGGEPCSQRPTYDTLATTGKQAAAGMLAIARIRVATGTPTLKGQSHEIQCTGKVLTGLRKSNDKTVQKLKINICLFYLKSV